MSNVVADRLRAARIERPLYRREIPTAARMFPRDPLSIAIEPASLAQELDATSIAKTIQELHYELLRRTAVFINDREIADMDWVEQCSPQVRELLITWMKEINEPAKEVQDLFRASQTILTRSQMSAPTDAPSGDK